MLFTFDIFFENKDLDEKDYQKYALFAQAWKKDRQLWGRIVANSTVCDDGYVAKKFQCLKPNT